jgi:hypothetical protein
MSSYYQCAKIIGINKGLFRTTQTYNFFQRIYQIKFQSRDSAKSYVKGICKDPDYLHISISIADSDDELLYACHVYHE